MVSERVSGYQAFNKRCKLILREFRIMVPTLSTQLGMLLILLKMTKHCGSSMPHRFYSDLVERPLGDRLAARDERYFTSDAFTVPGHEDLVLSMKEAWQQLGPQERARTWELMDELANASFAIGQRKDAKYLLGE